MIPEKRERKSIADAVSSVENEGFIKGTDVFNSIIKGRSEGYTKDNCPHPEYVVNGQYLLCTQCGYNELT
ncbi:MAG: hypothetical protein AABY26_06245 [Nanoarchaeota archaeon]